MEIAYESAGEGTLALRLVGPADPARIRAVFTDGARALETIATLVEANRDPSAAVSSVRAEDVMAAIGHREGTPLAFDHMSSWCCSS